MARTERKKAGVSKTVEDSQTVSKMANSKIEGKQKVGNSKMEGKQ